MRVDSHGLRWKAIILIAFLAVNAAFVGCSESVPESGITTVTEGEYSYETVDGDPLKTRIYTLGNGLKVYMTVYKDEPRIQTYIAVRAGSKNDPADATGLAHYLEHMLFKGTDKYGTVDYEKESKEIERIIELYEVYNETTDPAERKAVYRQIDSVSQIAAQYAAPNEFTKMVSAMGANGTNAYTSNEETVYINNIPSNQLEKWLTIEAERFRKPVMRLFHTELETVYEEKNRSLDNDRSKVFHALNAALFHKHPYGTQTTIGEIEHLKNPRLTKVIEYYNTYYVPNNMAIMLSGDFDPDQAIKLIDQKFGSKPSKEIAEFVPPQEEPITEPRVTEVLGPDAESVMLAFRLQGAKSKDADLLTMVDMILMNRTAGLIDINLNQNQKVIEAISFPTFYRDYSSHTLGARPRDGQTLEEVRDLLLSQIELIKKGEFPEWLMEATINDMKLEQMKSFEDNRGRVRFFVDAFIQEQPWDYYVSRFDRLRKITKQQIVDFANANYSDNYAIIYKRTGVDNNIPKVVKPEITPLDIDRTRESEFVAQILQTDAPEISPVFVDYEADIEKFSIKSNLPVHYVANKENDLFQLYYVVEMGQDHDKRLPLAMEYLKYLGTSNYTPSELAEEFYKIGCSFSVSSSEDQINVSLSGLSENFEKGLTLLEEVLSDPQPNEEALANLVQDEFKKRADSKLSKQTVLWEAMYNYGMYGPNSSFTNVLSKEELQTLKAAELIDLIKSISGYEHRILYYGPADRSMLTAALEKHHIIPDELQAIPEPQKYKQQDIEKNAVYVVDFDMQQTEIIMLSKDKPFNKTSAAIRSLFNSYYGGSMSSVVFQTIRESKALAYAVFAAYTTPAKKEEAHYVLSYIGTQTDKVPEAMAGMNEMLNEMPVSEAHIASAKEAVLKQIQTERITKSDILWNYERAMKRDLDYDLRKDVYEGVPVMNSNDVKAFHEEHLKGKNFACLVIGDTDRIDMKALQKYGDVQMVSLEEAFGY